MRNRRWIGIVLFGFSGWAAGLGQQPPQPRAVDPGCAAQAPSDAVVLFDGQDLSEWVHRNGQPAAWNIESGVIVCKSGTGDILTRRKIGSAQIHVEFSTPYMPQAKDQARGNSGVYLQGRYEIQINPCHDTSDQRGPWGA